jgi:hypothetical protein
MPLLKPRNRSVVFRLTQEEYEALHAACIRSGGRSISDYARTSLLNSIAQPGASANPAISRLEAKLNETNSALQSLVFLVTRFLKPGS